MERINDTELSIVGERYSSFTEFYQVNSRRALNAVYAEKGAGVSDRPFEVDAGVVFGPEDTRQALLQGSPIFEERFKRASAKAERIIKHKYEWLEKRHVKTDVLGQNVLVERYMSGHPETFARRRVQTLKQRSVHIVYDATCSASTDVERRIEAGCAVLAAAQALERIGYKTAISVAIAKFSGTVGGDDPTLLLEVTIKDFSDSLNARRMQFALAGKSLLFHVGCWWTRRFAQVPCDYGDGEGYPCTYDKARVKALEEYAKKRHGVFLSEDFVDLKLDADAVRVLEQVVEGVEGEDELRAHLRTSTPLSAAVPSEQGRMFSTFAPTPIAGEGQGGTSARAEAADEGKEQPVLGRQSAGKVRHAPAPFGQGSSKIGDSAGSSRAGSGLGQDGSTRAQGDGGNRQGADAVESPSGSEQRRQSSTGGKQGVGASEIEERPGQDRTGSHNAGMGKDTSEKGSGPSGDGSSGSGGGSGDAPGKGRASAPDDELPGSGREPTGSKAGERRENDGASAPDPGNKTRKAPTSASDSQAGTASGSGQESDDSHDSEEQDMTEEQQRKQGEPEEQQELKGAPVPPEEKFDIDAERLDDIEEDPFVVMLRKRIARFENGDYLNMQIDQKMARRKAEGKGCRDGAVPAPPAPKGKSSLEMGPARNTPFSMTYRP